MSRRNKNKKKRKKSGSRAANAVRSMLAGSTDHFATMLAKAVTAGLVTPEEARDAISRRISEERADSQNPFLSERHWSPEELAEELGAVARSAVHACSQKTIAQASKEAANVSLSDIDLHSHVSGTVSTAGQSCKIRLEFRYHDYTFDTECSCRAETCVHSYHLAREILRQLEDDASEINRLIFGEDYLEQKRREEAEQRERQRRHNQQRVLTLLKSIPSETDTALSLEEETFPATERVVWNLATKATQHNVSCELKVVRQKETKSGGWSRGREVSLKNFMEMPRDGWTDLDWAMAEAIKVQNWHPTHSIRNDRAFALLAGSERVQLNREPARVSIRPFELIVQDSADGGWQLATSATRTVREWNGSGTCVLTTHGTISWNGETGEVIWVRIPDSLRELTKLIISKDMKFSTDDRSQLLETINSLDSSVPLLLPESLGGKEIPEETQLVLLARIKKTGALEVTTCVRDSRQRLMLAGSGSARRRDQVDGQPVQYLRDIAGEKSRAEQLVDQLSLRTHRSIRPSTWLIEDPEAIISLLGHAAELAADESLVVVWHKESARELNIVGNLSPANVSVKVSRQRDWFGVDGTCTIGGEEVRLQDVLSGLRGTSSMDGLIEVSAGKWAAIADDFRTTLQRLADAASESRGKLQLDASAAMSLSAIEEESLRIEADKAWQKCMDKVRSMETINPDPPAGLDCVLRDYQIAGFRWMCRLAEWGVGGILADDMGLGKTVQTLAVLLQRIESGPALVIAPTSLGFNWQEECRRFTPSLNPTLLREADREELITSASEGDVVICSYGLALRETKLLQSVKWGTLVLDEAQNVKNSNARTSKEVRKLKADWKVALTGTPMENHLGELWSIFRAVSPGVLGSWEQFRKKFAGPIEKDQDSERRAALSQMISPFILRRAKSEVLTDLPERTESNIMIELTAEERERYDHVRLAAVGELDSLGEDDVSRDQRFRVLQLLTRLRQIACHVSLVDDEWQDGSSKLTILMERLQQLKERGHRPLVFSQFTSHLGLIREACDTHGITYQYLDGQTTPKARQKRVTAFQNGESDAFLISLKAGGTGLNLTAADYVIHMDPWWNPAVEDQATDRAHRIGQQNHVMVYRLIARGTIEEQILSLHAEKRDLVEGVLSGSESAARMSTEELADLIRGTAAGSAEVAR